MHFYQIPTAIVLLLATSASSVTACDFHSYHRRSNIPLNTLRGPHVRREVLPELTRRAEEGIRDWTYANSAGWASIKAEYFLCGNGTQQSPIPLFTQSRVLDAPHKPTFVNYDRAITGELSNWGFGPSFTAVHTPGDMTTLPQLQFDAKTTYMMGWHMHFAAEHQIDGTRAAAELHLVHADAAGHPAAVVGIQLKTGATETPFLPTGVFQYPAAVAADQNATKIADVPINVFQAIQGAGSLESYWTYEGSLTTPPCGEGLRWYVSASPLTVSQPQMDALLQANAGQYSARIPQLVMNQRVNQ